VLLTARLEDFRGAATMLRDTMSGRMTEQAYLRGEQYRDSGNLRARMGLHERFGVNPYGWFGWVFDRIAPPPGCRILEIGCGPGRLWLENADRLGMVRALTLADSSPGMAREARDALARALPGAAIRAVSADAQALPFADASFDLVVANHMLYHVPDRPRAFAEIGRVLRPGGRFYAATNGGRHMREIYALATGELPGEAEPRETLGFSLENGAAQLAPFFAEVALARYDDALVVTEAEPLLAYIRSIAHLDAAGDARLAATIAELLARDGAIRITKETGMFVARNE
jgi:SAM-dependent methyltransferase